MSGPLVITTGSKAPARGGVFAVPGLISGDSTQPSAVKDLRPTFGQGSSSKSVLLPPARETTAPTGRRQHPSLFLSCRSRSFRFRLRRIAVAHDARPVPEAFQCQGASVLPCQTHQK